MKAILLAGGKGTRGKPYTEYFPKAMTPFEGKPIVEYVIKYLSSFGFITEIIIISDVKGLGGQILNYLEKSKIKKKVSFVQDSECGTGGDLLHIATKLKRDSEFLLWFSDNLCALDLKKMAQRFKDKKSLACIATRTKRKEETGFAVIKDYIITEFKEKPVLNLPLSECLGIYILSTEIIKKIKLKSKGKPINLSYDILTDLAKKGLVSSFDIGNKLWIDVESPTLLERNKDIVKKITRQMGF